MGMDRDIAEVLYSEEELKRRVAALGAQISRDYADKEDVVLVGILRGSYIFLADLSRYITIPCRIDFMAASSYGKGTSSSGQIEIKKDLSDSINGAHVILVEDILDSGNTPCWISRSGGPSPSRRTITDSWCRTPLWWATDWILLKSTVICPISAF